MTKIHQIQLFKQQKFIAILTMTILSTNSALSDGSHNIIARSGDTAFGTPTGALFSSFNSLKLNSKGQVVYWGALQSGAGGVNSSNNSGIWRDNTLVVREGFQASGTPSGALFSSFGPLSLNSKGQVAFQGTLQTGVGGVTSSNNAGIWRDNTVVAREGFQASGTPSGALFSNFFSPALNSNGQVAYWGALQTGAGGVISSNNAGIWRDNTLVAREGSQASGTPSGALFSSLTSPVLSSNGQVVFHGTLQTGAGGVTFSNDRGIWRDNTLVVREGSQASGTPTGALFSSLSNSKINSNGQVAYSGTLQAGAGGVILSNNSGIWLDNTLVVREGSQASGTPSGALFSSLFNPVLNSNGQIAYWGTLQTGAGGVTSSNNSGIWLDNTLVVREGSQASGTPSGALFSGISSPTLNSNGQVAYWGTLQTDAGGVTFDNDFGLWVNGSNNDSLKVVREGDTLDGKTVSSISFTSDSFNDFSQLAYRVGFTNGDRAVVLFTPDLHWLKTYSGHWDSNSSWTIAQDPDEVHDVFIDPSTNLTVTGSARARTVKQLTIGGGTGIGTLSLNGGNLTVLNGVNIASTGVLTGTGVITGTVTNQGEVRAKNVTISGGNLINQGQIRGQSSGLNRINATVINTASGEIELINNESLRLTQGGHSNDGRVTVINSRMTVDGSFANNTGGRIQGRNALLEFNGGLSNSGQVQLSFGTSDVFGEITNNNTGSLINSGGGNVTYYDDIKNNGEIRTSTGSQSVFFGDYTGTGVLTGSGSNQFEGGFAPGASPFMATSTADVGFGFINNTIIELAGSTRGLGTASEYDGLDVLGGKTLTLDGILDVLLIDDLTSGYSPSLDDMFLIFTAGLIDGDFHTINLPTLDLGLNWLVNNDGQNYTLTVAAVPLPAGVWLFISAMAGLMVVRRRV